jgi:uncharacterized SAM-binding protein YcdF (DUF218 family)
MTSMFLVKKIVGGLLTPPLIALALAVVGCMFYAVRRRRAAAAFVLAGVAVAYVSSLDAVGLALLAPLELRYPPLAPSMDLANVRYVVVLGSSYRPHDSVPVTAALDYVGLMRIVEGVRLAKRLDAARLVVSGGGATGSAVGYAALARDLGISSDAIVLNETSLDTGDEARQVARLVGAEPFLLVTSANHMPRAVRLMERAGAHPIPAPTDQRVGASAKPVWATLLPDAEGLRDTQTAVHEYLGLAAIALGID